VAEVGQVAASRQVSVSGKLVASCSCRVLSQQTLLWHHRLAHPSRPHLRSMHSRLLVSGLPRFLPFLPCSPAPPCLPCLEGRQHAAPHSFEFPPATAPLQTLHMDVWSPASVGGTDQERYFLLVVDDYTRYTTVFPLRHKADVSGVLIPWIRATRHQLRERFSRDFSVLRLHSDRGGEFSSDLLAEFCQDEGIVQSFTLPASPRQNKIVGRRIGLIMEVARTSMIHAAPPHFLWPFAVRYVAHQLNLWPHVSEPETSPILRWTGKVGDASVFRGPAPSGVSQVDPPPLVEPLEISSDSSGLAEGGDLTADKTPVAVDFGAETAGAEPGGAETEGEGSGGAATWGAATGGAATGGAGSWGAATEGADYGGPASPSGCGAVGDPAGGPGAGQPPQLDLLETLSAHAIRAWIVRTHGMALRPSSVPQRVVLPEPLASSLPHIPDPESDLARAASPTVTRLLDTVLTDLDLESTAAFALVTELVNFAARSRLDYVASLVTESESICPPSVGGELALGIDVLEDRQFELECLAGALPRFGSALLCPEGDPDALDIPTPRSYAEAIAGTYVDEVPPPGGNIVDGMWIFRVKRPPGSPPVFKARYQSVTTSCTPSTSPQLSCTLAFTRRSGCNRPPGFTGLFPVGTQWSLWRPVYSLRQAPRERHDTLMTTLAALGFAPSSADPSLFLRTDTALPPFYVLVYVVDLDFATADTEALDLSTAHHHPDSVTHGAPGPSALWLPVLLATAHSSVYRPLALSSTFGRVHTERCTRDATKRVLRYLCCTLGMGLVLGGQGSVVLTRHSDASWADDQGTQRSSQGYTFSLGSDYVLWRSTRSSSVLSSSCDAEIYAGAMVAQELR
ncbi:unnamed protein product, partial [Closterium sp. NIES-53]